MCLFMRRLISLHCSSQDALDLWLLSKISMRRLRSDCMAAQVDPSLRSAHMRVTEEPSPVSIFYKFIVGRYRPVRVADGPITARYRFIKTANWALSHTGHVKR